MVPDVIGRGFELEDVEFAAPRGREVLIEVCASGLCHTDLLFATNSFVLTPAVLGHEVAGCAITWSHRTDPARHSSPTPDMVVAARG
jgi:S-(hydroxymethyl)glutathione dehydrogenase/alcohol dehydrogenase